MARQAYDTRQTGVCNTMRKLSRLRCAIFTGLLTAACVGTVPETEEPQGAAPLPAPTQADEASSSAESEVAAPSTPEPRWQPVDSNPEPGVGADFKNDLDVVFRVGACGTTQAVPQPLDAGVVDEHCKRLRGLMQRYRDRYLSKAKPFFAKIRPAELPPRVVYPFGGGDLMNALMVYPDAHEITTISLEYAGDPRRLSQQKSKEQLKKGLFLIDQALKTQLRGGWNWTRNMEAAQKAGVPEQLTYALVALVVHNYKPLSLRYFTLRPDGTIKYLDSAAIEALADKRPEKIRYWGAPDYSAAFSNMEIRFQALDGGPIKVYRHMAEDLSNGNLTRDAHHLTKDPSLLAHLEAKGQVAALTRAASHLLWEDSFSEIRDYLTRSLMWMPSDSTGLPPPIAQAAGLQQQAYGQFAAAFEPSDQGSRRRYNPAFQALFAKTTQEPLGFLFGYPDKNKKGHMVVTHRPE